MTPTLLGRWQTRIFLFFTVGALITVLFALGIVGSGAGGIYFFLLLYLALFGLGWDVVYNFIQKSRWDRDWPAAFQLAAGVWEAIFLILIIYLPGDLPGIDKSNFPLGAFFWHYSCVWLGIFTASQTIMRVLFPRWRFNGGQLL